MLFILALLLAAPDDLEAKLRHLGSASAAWAPAPAHDGSRIAFLTTLFGTRQAASMAMDGGYPFQLTDEPGGVVAVRYLPSDDGRLIALAKRGGLRRILILDEAGTPSAEIDPLPGDQIPGGVTRDGKRFIYAVASGGKVALRAFPFDAKKPVEIEPPPPAANAQPPAGSQPLAEALAGLFALGPIAPDGRSILALVRRSAGETLVQIDIAAARGTVLTDVPARYRQPRFAPDGKSVYVMTDAGRATLGVDAITLQNKSRKTVYAPAQDLQAFAVTDDGHRLAVATEAGGETLFSLLELPSLRAQPLASPPSGALAEVAEGESPLTWDRVGERLFFGWQLADDTTDVWELRTGYGTPVRLTRSPRPGLPRNGIVRPTPVKLESSLAFFWRPVEPARPRVAVLISAGQTRPVFDKRIAALNFAGVAVLAVNGKGAQAAALAYLREASDLDPRAPLLLDFEGLAVDEPAKWGAVVAPHGGKGGVELDGDQPDLAALVKSAGR